MTFRAVCVLLSVIGFTGCAPHKYRAAPLSPPNLATALEARSLDDPELRSWMEQAGKYQIASWPLPSWDLDSLTLAAWYFNPELDVARANLAAAGAATTTAAMKPNPSVSIGPGYEDVPESAFMMTFDLSFPIETAGKRGYRIDASRHLTEASRLQLAETAWSIRSRVRAAWISYLFAMEASDVLRSQETLQAHYVDLLQQRLRAGEIPLPEVTSAEVDLTNARQALRTAEGQINIAHANLAAAIGIPDAALAGKNMSWPGKGTPPLLTELPSQEVRTAAVTNRLEVRRALAQYEAAQSNLQLEIARQYPDVNIGPGYGFEEAFHLVGLNLSSVIPLRNHNEGPIAEAEAQRKVAGAQLLTVQSNVIAETDKALAEYRAAYETLQQAQQAAAQIETEYRAAQQAMTSGESDQLALLSIDLQRSNAARSQIEALLQAQVSLGHLEDALEHPIAPANSPIFPAQTPRLQEKVQ